VSALENARGGTLDDPRDPGADRAPASSGNDVRSTGAPSPVTTVPPGPPGEPHGAPRAGGGRNRSKILIGAGAVAGIAVAGTVIAVTGGTGAVQDQLAGAGQPAAKGAALASSDAQPVAVTASSCGAGWSLRTTGAAAFAVSNQAGKRAEVTLRNSADDSIIAEVEGLGPKVTRQLSATVNPGSYYWLCQFRDSTSSKSQIVKVTGPVVAVAEPLLEVTEDDMAQPVSQYKTYVAGQLTLLRTQVATLRSDLAGGDTAKAKADWIIAHQTYHRVGAAYNAFGDDGEGVDGLAQGLPGGTADKDFTGFHKIEKLLWSGTPPRSIVPEADTLAEKAGVLVTKLPTFTFDPNDISLRTHEILEGTARFQLTGADDYGSGTSLATAQADVEGTQELVKILTPLVDARAKGLPNAITKQLATLSASIQGTKANGQWVAVSSVPEAKRRQLNGLTGGVLELLSTFPDMLEIRK
jgi:high-affinity iron transporter